MTETTDMLQNETQTPAAATLPPLEERPLVTFVLFAYNQEDYIREAVEGAFSQTYEPLEIILSDDCSSDRTFEIMQEMAAAYEGPHEVRVRRNEVNEGLVGHLSNVVEEINGEWSVVAAGDDVSYAERTVVLYNAWSAKTNVSACFSDYDDMTFIYRKPIEKEFIGPMRHLRSGGGEGLGATYAYKTSVLKMMIPISNYIKHEDRIIPFISSLSGRVMHVKKSLVLYRNKINDPSIPTHSFSHALYLKEHWKGLRAHLHKAQNKRIISRQKLCFFLILSVCIEFNAHIRKIIGSTFGVRASNLYWRVTTSPLRYF